MHSHQHTSSLLTDIVLTLPDNTGWYDRLLQFVCSCGWGETVTGNFHTSAAPVTAALLDTLAARERTPWQAMTLSLCALSTSTQRPN